MRLIDADKADVEQIGCFYGAECRLEDVQEWLDEQPTVDIKTEVAREIFAEIEKKKINIKDHTGKMGDVVMLKDITELKNKYTKEGVGE